MQPDGMRTANVTGAGFTASGLTLPLTLNPGQTATLHLAFNPSATGSAAGQLSVTSDASGSSIQVPVSGNGVTPTSPQLTVSTNTLAFGNVNVNSSATLPLTLTSTGTGPVTITAASLNGASFSDSGTSLPVTLSPNQSLTVQVQFHAGVVGLANGSLAITSNSASGGSAQVALTRTGVAPATAQISFSTTSLSFGNLAVGSTSTMSLAITSTGTAPVTISAAALAGAEFSVSGASVPLTLNPTQSVILQVQFDPTTAGGATGQLTITSNASSGSTTQVLLSGTGTAVTHEVDLSWDPPASSPDPVAGYNVYRSSNGGATFSLLNAAPQTQQTYVDASIASGAYTYLVKSVDAAGVESGPSNQFQATVP